VIEKNLFSYLTILYVTMQNLWNYLSSRLRENIKDASMSDLRDFLENIIKHSPKIGEVAMRHVGIFFFFV